MRCPVCKERVIDFLVWSQGINAFCKRDCPRCGTHLRVSRRTVIVFILFLVLSVPFVVVIAETLKAFGIPESTAGVIFGCLMIPLAGVAAYFEWRTGFYAVRSSVPQIGALDQSDNAAPSGLGSLRLLFVAGLAVGLIAFMIALGYRDLLLIFDRHISEGWITGVHSPPPGAIRVSDYRVSYEFAADSGLVYFGEDVLPPAQTPSQDGKILVVYSSRDPSVSRIASQLSGAPVAGMALGAGLLLWSLAKFVRLRRR